MLGPGAVLGENGERIPERPRELAVQRIFGEAFMLVPADDPAGEDHPAFRAKCRWNSPSAAASRTVEDLHETAPLSKSRAMICRCTSLAPS